MSSEQAQVIGCHTEAEWQQHFNHGKTSGKLVVVDFTASWCGPCRFIAPILQDMAKKLTHVIFLKVDVDELKSVAATYDIEAMPTFVFFKNGNKVDMVVGARKDELQKKIDSHATGTATA